LLPEYCILAKGYTWRLILPATLIVSTISCIMHVLNMHAKCNRERKCTFDIFIIIESCVFFNYSLFVESGNRFIIQLYEIQLSVDKIYRSPIGVL
jgi:hypothetical protein